MNRIVSFTVPRYQKYLCITTVVLYQHFFEALISFASSREAFSACRLRITEGSAFTIAISLHTYSETVYHSVLPAAMIASSNSFVAGNISHLQCIIDCICRDSADV